MDPEREPYAPPPSRRGRTMSWKTASMRAASLVLAVFAVALLDSSE